MRSLPIILLAAHAASAAVSFKADLAPILLQRCVTCHGPDKAKGAFRLDTFSTLMKGGDSKKSPVIPGDLPNSHLFQLLVTNDPDDRMPQNGDRLTDAEIRLFREWIQEGGKFDGLSPDQNLATIAPFQPGPEPLPYYPFPHPVLALAWSPDGKILAAGGYHEAILWSGDGKLARRISRLPERIHGLAFLNDGSLAVAAGSPGKSGEVLICSLDSSTPPLLLARLPDVVTCLAVNSDRTMIAAGGADNAIRIFDAVARAEIAIVQQHADWVTALTFSGDGTRLASVSRDRTARLFNARDGNLIETYVEHSQPLFAVAMAADGKKIFSGGREKRVHAWDASEAKKRGEFPSLEGDILALCAAGPRLYASGADKAIREFSMDDRKQVRILPGHRDWIYALAWSEKAKRLASGSYDGEIRIWNGENGDLTVAFRAAP